MHIFMVGYMGVGKTTIGKQLSTSLGLPFIDLDELVYTKMGKDIPEIFNTHGEKAFREIEREILLDVCTIKQNHVVALGGGTMCHLNNHSEILRFGIAVYLFQPWRVLQKQLGALANRPLIVQHTEEELEALYHKRVTYYEYSQLKINLDENWQIQRLINYLKLSTNR